MATAVTKTVTERRESHKLFSHTVGHMGRQTIPQKKANLDPMQPIGHLSGTEERKDRNRSKK